jgi:hypothetical protein
MNVKQGCLACKQLLSCIGASGEKSFIMLFTVRARVRRSSVGASLAVGRVATQLAVYPAAGALAVVVHCHCGYLQIAPPAAPATPRSQKLKHILQEGLCQQSFLRNAHHLLAYPSITCATSCLRAIAAVAVPHRLPEPLAGS